MDSTELRRSVDIDLGASVWTTLLKFRCLPEVNKLGETVVSNVMAVLQERGLKVGTGTILDAIIISTPSSTTNTDK